ncbi:hypothetical protein [Galactobacter caseinivorans]|nr:hypothetical protein [Galactobacter caseinivorans]
MTNPQQGTPRPAGGKRADMRGKGPALSHQVPKHTHSTRRGA